VHLPFRMTQMLSRVRFDIGEALADANREALDAAAIRCVLCRAHGACDAWTAKHGQGKDLEVPAFCTNKDYVAAFQPPGHDARA
jgi:Family of unknown function (DUF6455)